MTARTYYAIGDVHGEAELLGALHQAIIQRRDASGGDPATIVHLGDLIDRGADSRGAIKRVRALQAAPPEGMRVVALRGNHEQMLLDAFDQRTPQTLLHWLENGGDATLESYARRRPMSGDDPLAVLDPGDLAWLRDLPTVHHDPSRNVAFVHAGIEPQIFPEDPDEVRLWTRSARFFETASWPERDELRDLLVVHGHTPTTNGQPEVVPRRINIDTGAVFGGPLTCVELRPGEAPTFLYARRQS